MYFNGYIPANRINSRNAAGQPNGVMGVPSNYRPYLQPIIPTPADGGAANDPNRPSYETNNVAVRLNNGIDQRVGFDTGLHPLQNQFFLGPMQWNMAGSLFKSVPITERLVLRVNADFLDNAFNSRNHDAGGTGGVILNRTSANSPRVLQLTMRLTW